MIIAKRKPLNEIKEMLAGYKKVLVVACDTCVAVCLAGGEKEAGLLAAELDMAYKLDNDERTFDVDTCQRQCDMEYMEHLDTKVGGYDALISTACGVGIQFLNERFQDKVVLPGVNTTFIGANVDVGVWEEKCRMCGDCMLGWTGGICPMTRCAKRLMNGPCGGTKLDNTCEVSDENPCAWALIWERLEKQGRLDLITKVRGSRDNRTQQFPAKQTHPAYEKRYSAHE